MIYAKDGTRIDSIANWPRPKDPDVQWQVGRSAMELARAWTREADACSPPAEFLALMRNHDVFADLRIVSGAPEALVAFDSFAGPRNADLNLVCAGASGAVVISVEAKADETYGSTVAAELRKVRTKLANGVPTNALTRINALLQRFVPDVGDHSTIRYQLLTATAATLRLAEREQATRALLVIHEFIGGTRSDGRKATTGAKVEANAAALNTFVRALSRDSIDRIVAPSIVGPFPLGAGPLFYIGKLQTDLSIPPV